jgi:hypothetical protein
MNKVAQFSGADAQKLEDTLRKYGADAPVAESAAAAGAGGATSAAGVGLVRVVGGGRGVDVAHRWRSALTCGRSVQLTLDAFLDIKQCECLNQSETATLQKLLSREGKLESDCDAQLLITVAFSQPVKLHSLRLASPAAGAKLECDTSFDRC